MYKKLFQMFLVVGMSTSLTANDCNTSCEPCAPCEPCDFCPPAAPTQCAYNAPYIIDVNSCLCWDIYATANFLWWEALEEGLEVGLTTTTGAGSLPFTNGKVVDMNFEYKPGFKVGLGFGFGCDNWEFYSEYTRYHPSISGSAAAPTTVDGNLYSFWTHANTGDTETDSSTTWNLDMDYVDFSVRREFYVGKCLTFRPFLGLRAAWIDQEYNATVNGVDGSDIVTVNNSSDSWAVGVASGMHTKWLFCSNFRLFGNFLTSILYTDYTLKGEQTVTDSSGVVLPADGVDFKQSPNYLRPNMELSIGLGWGDYFFCNDYYFDVTLGYDFNVFWNQNVFRKFIDDVNEGRSYMQGDLFIHGLNVSASLYF